MSKKAHKSEIDTYLEGPRKCGAFSAEKDLCHFCVSNGVCERNLCYERPGKKAEGK